MLSHEVGPVRSGHADDLARLRGDAVQAAALVNFGPGAQGQTNGLSDVGGGDDSAQHEAGVEVGEGVAAAVLAARLERVRGGAARGQIGGQSLGLAVAKLGQRRVRLALAAGVIGVVVGRLGVADEI